MDTWEQPQGSPRTRREYAACYFTFTMEVRQVYKGPGNKCPPPPLQCPASL